VSTILVLVEHKNGVIKRASLEAVGAGRSVADDVVAFLFGEGAAALASGLGASGASRTVVLEGAAASPDVLAEELAATARELGAKAVLSAATSTGRDVMPRTAALLDENLFSDCTGLSASGDALEVVRPMLAGKLIATLKATGTLCATLRRNTFAPASGGGEAEVVQRAASATAKAVLTALEAKEGGKLDVSEAPIVVSGGRGLKEPENFGIVEELAKAFGDAAIGASRAVVDAGWRPHSEQVGQTGKTVSPQLYVAIAISGAIQHLAGMKTSKVIVAINKDADAPIFKVADYGIVGDAFEIVPALAAEVAKIRAQA